MRSCIDGALNDASTRTIPRALQDIFKKIRQLESEGKASVTCTCSLMELYYENLYDLLSGKEREGSTFEIREDINKGIVIKGFSEHRIDNEEKSGGANRTTGATAMNDVSSRSNAIFAIDLTLTDVNGHSKKTKFSLVDFAGSERSKKTKMTGVRFTEDQRRTSRTRQRHFRSWRWNIKRIR
jgi:kinesin family member 4